MNIIERAEILKKRYDAQKYPFVHEVTSGLIDLVKQQQEALEALDVVLDFSEPIGRNEAICIDNPDAINAAFRKANEALKGGEPSE